MILERHFSAGDTFVLTGPTRQRVGELGRTRRRPRASIYPGALQPSGLWGLCESRALCTRAKPPQDRAIRLQAPIQYAALQAAQAWYESEEGQRQYAKRAGVEGTLAQGVRAFGMRHARYRGLGKAHLERVMHFEV